MKNIKSKVIKHLKGDIKTYKHEADEDRKLMKSLKHKEKMHPKIHKHLEGIEHHLDGIKKHHAKHHESKKHEKHESKAHEKHESKHEEKMEHKKHHSKHHDASKYENKKGKVHKVMKEFKEGKLHSGSKKGPEVKKKSQAIAIALNTARKAGAKIKKKK